MINCLVLEDDDLNRFGLCSILRNEGVNVFEAATVGRAQEILEQQSIDIAFSDLDIEKALEGLSFLPVLIKKGIYTVIISGHQEDEIVCEAYSKGCSDYLTKPYQKKTIKRILQKYYLQSHEKNFQDLLRTTFVTKSPELIYQLNMIQELVLSDRPVLITGETGTGKTLLAKLIHKIKIGEENQLIHLNCSELSENLLESELFGHVKGAFSDATYDKKGKLELADGGTLFLDEVATMPMSLQKKLLKAIEEKSFYPVGSEKKISSNFQIISATCENLEQKIEEKSFRLDLFYRIDGFKIHLPSLQERKNDIGILLKHFLGKGDRRVIIDAQAQECLQDYQWPGNVRELEHLVDILKTKSSGVIRTQDLPGYIKNNHHEYSNQEFTDAFMGQIRSKGLKQVIAEIESNLTQKVLNENNGHVRQTLKDLKISSSSFYSILKK